MKCCSVLCVLLMSVLNCFSLDREAFTFTMYDLDVRIEPEQQRLAVRGTNFQIRVWRALLELGSAGPTTYAALARAAGVAGGARAVGNAVGANPVAWLIPCHNVLRKDG